MKTLLGCLLIASLLVSPLSAQSEAPKRIFNPDQFAGLVAQDLNSYEGALLDYELDRKDGGSIHFQHCQQVETTREEYLLESQYPLFKKLLINCLALKRYAASTEAKRSFFPARLKKSDIAAFPATATVWISEASIAQRQGKTLADYEKRLDVSINAPNSATVITKRDELKYHIMARADFDEDGFEDLLLRVDWHARDAMGSGTDLILLSKKSRDAPITVAWRP